jgi:hypothetical protein
MYELVLKKLLHKLLSTSPIYKLNFLCTGYFFTFVVFCIRLLRKLWILLNCEEMCDYLYDFTIIEFIFLWGVIILLRNLYVCPFCKLGTEKWHMTHLWSFHPFHPQNQKLASDAELWHQFTWEQLIYRIPFT